MSLYYRPVRSVWTCTRSQVSDPITYADDTVPCVCSERAVLRRALLDEMGSHPTFRVTWPRSHLLDELHLGRGDGHHLSAYLHAQELCQSRAVVEGVKNPGRCRPRGAREGAGEGPRGELAREEELKADSGLDTYPRNSPIPSVLLDFYLLSISILASLYVMSERLVRNSASIPHLLLFYD